MSVIWASKKLEIERFCVQLSLNLQTD